MNETLGKKLSQYPLALSLNEKWERSYTNLLIPHLHCRGHIQVNDIVYNLRASTRLPCTLCYVFTQGFNSLLTTVTT